MPISSGTVRTGVTAVRYESVVGKESRPPITIRFTGWAVAAKRLGCGQWRMHVGRQGGAETIEILICVKI